MKVVNFIINWSIKILRVMFLLLTVATVVVGFLTIWYLIDFESYRLWMDKLGGIIEFVSEYATSVGLLILGRLSSNIKDNIKGILTAIVMLSTFVVNITRYKSLKRDGKELANEKA